MDTFKTLFWAAAFFFLPYLGFAVGYRAVSLLVEDPRLASMEGLLAGIIMAFGVLFGLERLAK